MQPYLCLSFVRSVAWDFASVGAAFASVVAASDAFASDAVGSGAAAVVQCEVGTFDPKRDGQQSEA
jgi:hypothetical protein